jgi:exodeoxyribonuclease VIII
MEALPITLSEPETIRVMPRPAPETPCGIFPDMDEEIYRAAPGIAQSSLKEMRYSPAHYHAAITRGPQEPTPEMIIGTAVHCAVLQPQLFDSSYIEFPANMDMRTAEGREWKRRSGGFSVLKQEVYKMVLSIRASVRRHPLAREAIERSVHEVSVFAPIKIGDRILQRKGRIDMLPSEGRAITDLKTVPYGGASAELWPKKLASMIYHLQSAYYIDLCNDAAGSVQWDSFVHIAVEKERPYAVAVYLLDQDAIDAGRDLYRKLLRQVAECEESGDWPAYSQELLDVALPRWARPQITDADIFA